MTVNRRSAWRLLLLLLVGATSADHVSVTTAALPSSTHNMLDTSPTPDEEVHLATTSRQPITTTAADPVLTPAAGPSNNSFADLRAVYLFTRSHGSDTDYELLDPNQIKTITDSSFLQNSKTYLLLPGFLDKGNTKWILKLKTKLLERENCNVLCIEYDTGSSNDNETFINASARVPTVGTQTAGLLDLLVKLQQQDLHNLHIIGHCLGAHVGGIAGLTAKGTVGRITGLDPTGLSFNTASRTKRLSNGDADFVDVIHTSGCKTINQWGDCMGIDKSVGHSDFWPNGGYFQPACRHSGKHHIDHICNHRVAQDYFLESFSYSTDRTMFLARPDINYEHYCISVQCGHDPQYMGINARKVSRDTVHYYLNTSVQTPYGELDSSCPSLLSWRLIRGSIITAIVLLAIGLVSVVLPAVVLLFKCAKKHFVIQTVPYSSFEGHGAPPTAGHYCPPDNHSYGGARAGRSGDISSNFLVRRLLDSVDDEGSIVSDSSRTPLRAAGHSGHHTTHNYGGSGGEMLSDEDFQDCSASSVGLPAQSRLSAGRLILKSESGDYNDEHSEEGGGLLYNQYPTPQFNRPEHHSRPV